MFRKEGQPTYELTWKNVKFCVPLAPDGRKCDLCPFTDAQDDPVSLKKKPPVKEQMWWGYPPHSETGQTQGGTCGFCCRIYASRIRPQKISLSDYKASLGRDEKMLNAHQTMITTVIDTIPERGLVRNARLDWEQITTITLKTVRMMEMCVKRPGWQHVEWDHYSKMHDGKDLYSNAEGQAAGHKEFWFEGKRGVLIPDAPITKIEFNERIQGILEEQVQQSTPDEMLTQDEMSANLKGLAGNLFNMSKGHSAENPHPGVAPLGESTQGPFGALLKVSPQPHSHPAASALGLLGAAGGSGGAPPGGAPHSGAPNSKANGNSKLAATPPPSTPPSASCAAPAEAGAGAGAAPSAAAVKSKAKAKAKAEGAISGKETRGRKAKDHGAIMDKLAQEFADAPPSSPLYWGSEAKTGMKQFETLNKEIQARIKKSTVDEEIDKLRVLLKQTCSIFNVLQAVHDHGLGTAKFAEVFDMTITSTNLEPKVASQAKPPHPTRACTHTCAHQSHRTIRARDF